MVLRWGWAAMAGMVLQLKANRQFKLELLTSVKVVDEWAA
jgi:hypothetical protein